MHTCNISAKRYTSHSCLLLAEWRAWVGGGGGKEGVEGIKSRKKDGEWRRGDGRKSSLHKRKKGEI